MPLMPWPKLQVSGRCPSSERRWRPASEGGFTVIEVLITALVMAVVLLAATALMVQSSRAYRVNEAAAERQQEIEAAVKILSYDLMLGGYRGTTPAVFAGNQFSGPSLQVIKNGATALGSDKLIVRYFEESERLFGGQDTCGSPCVVTYDVDTGEDGMLLLYRQEGASEERGIVQEVESFRIREFITRTGRACDFLNPHVDCPDFPDNLAALNVQITFVGGGVWRFPVAVSNPQYQ